MPPCPSMPYLTWASSLDAAAGGLAPSQAHRGQVPQATCQLQLYTYNHGISPVLSRSSRVALTVAFQQLHWDAPAPVCGVRAPSWGLSQM